jgi:GntR family transcriptional regulator
MVFHLNFRSGTPVYLQLVEQVKAAAAAGALRPGEALPGIRPLAEELRVNRNTIAKAYGELEAQGLIETVHGKGSVLRAAASPLRKDVRRRSLADALDAAVVDAHNFRVGRAEFLALAAERYDALEQKRLRAAMTERP